MSRTIPPLKTYSHLAGLHRVPSEYEIVSSRLLYHVERGFEVNVPVAPFYRRYQTGSPLVAPDWERFADPRETTYAKYTELQAGRETHVAALFAELEEPEHTPSATWVRTVELTCGPWRFAVHGLQMAAAHVGAMAPGGRLTICAAFQAADELRRVQTLAYRLAQLRRGRPGFAAGSRELWQSDPWWQPLRRLVESLLVTYDWGEALVALNVCTKPVLDALWNGELGRVAQSRGAFPFASVLASLDEDARWHRAWTAALLRLALGHAGSRVAVKEWIARWSPPVAEAARALCEGLFPEQAAAMCERVLAAGQAYARELGEVGATP